MNYGQLFRDLNFTISSEFCGEEEDSFDLNLQFYYVTIEKLIIKIVHHTSKIVLANKNLLLVVLVIFLLFTNLTVKVMNMLQAFKYIQKQLK
jgi:hypothetical protein